MEEVLEQCLAFAKSRNNVVKKVNGLSLEEQLRKDILKFGLSIACIDGKLDTQEITIIENIVGVEVNDDFKSILGEVEEDKGQFLNEIPLSFEYFIQIDMNEGDSTEWLYNTRFLYKTFKTIGAVIIACNGARLKVEVAALNSFCKNIIKKITEIESSSGCMNFQQEKEKEQEKKAETADLIDKTNVLLDDVNRLIGLKNVKKEMHNLVNLLLVYKYREEKGFKNPPLAMHFVFTGNPGTGKTTIARKIAEIYKELGILSIGQLIEVDRSSLVAGYVGQTAEKVHQVVDKAMGGVLFIDEAYTLTSHSENDFGQEAIDILLKLMEDNRDKFVTIVAGYPKEMEDFLESNPGLRSRFNKRIEFEDYTMEELMAIFEKICAEYDYKMTDSAKAVLENIFKGIINNKNFANAREVRNYFEKVVNSHANRVMQVGISDSNQLQLIDDEDLKDL